MEKPGSPSPEISMSSNQSSDSQSSTDKKKKRSKEPKNHDVRFSAHRDVLPFGTDFGYFNLELPKDLEKSQHDLKKYPKVILITKDVDQSQCLTIMTLHHDNILQLHAAIARPDENLIEAYVEPYKGVLHDYLGQGSLYSLEIEMVPSPILQDLVSEMFGALNYIAEKGYYHGNISLHTTFYQNDGSKDRIKLANFETRDFETPEDGHVQDLFSLGVALEEISEIAKQNVPITLDASKGSSYCCIIDDLARLLKSVTKQTLAIVKEEVKDHVFFWDRRRRKHFFTTDVVTALRTHRFRENLTHMDLNAIPLIVPWDVYSYEEYKAKMVAYRDANFIGKFNHAEVEDFVRCISGMYTHKAEMKATCDTVDEIVHREHPGLCLHLKKAM